MNEEIRAEKGGSSQATDQTRLQKEELLDIKDLSVVYKTDYETVYAVNNVSLTVGKGETIGLVGETGAGKTTLALSIMGLLPDRTGRVTGGEIVYEGRNLLGLKKQEMRIIRGANIAMIFQDPMSALNPVHTVGKQIYEALKLHNYDNKSKAELEADVDRTLEMVGIPASRKKEYPHQFSGGMKQRIVIAIALSCKPDFLIADEPTTALDVTIQAQVLAMMNDLQQKMGMSMIMITHDLGIVAQTCDWVAVMYAGEIVEYGSLTEIFDSDKKHPYTEGLFNAIPNLNVETERLVPINGLMPDPTIVQTGCPFAERCEKCMEICKTTKPAAHVEGTHRIMCHLYSS